MTNTNTLLGRAAPLALLLALAPLGCGDDGDGPSGTGGEGGEGGGAGNGAGGNGGGSGGSAPEECEADFGPIDPTALIDDLEDGNGVIPRPNGGAWWIATDMTGGSVQPIADGMPSPEPILGGRCDSTYAMRVTGEGFLDWGIALSAAFRFTTDVDSIDASSYRGVRFWARRGETHTSPVRVQFQDAQTMPQGGNCDPDPTSVTACYNGFGTTLLPLDTEWRLYQLDFSRMEPRDFGFVGEALDATRLYQIEFGMVQGSVFDFWVDDVWFYE